METINNNIQESYVSFEVAKLLKEKGADLIGGKKAYNLDGSRRISITSYHYNDETYPITDCTQSTAIEWLRVNFGIWIKIDHFLTTENEVDWDFEIDTETTDIDENGNYTALRSYDIDCGYKTPQEATEQALLYCLTNLI